MTNYIQNALNVVPQVAAVWFVAGMVVMLTFLLIIKVAIRKKILIEEDYYVLVDDPGSPHRVARKIAFGPYSSEFAANTQASKWKGNWPVVVERVSTEVPDDYTVVTIK